MTQVIWFVLWSTLWAVYFVLDGFDFGAGMLYRFLARDDGERRVILMTVGPVWNGNEVWLVTAGGATFAAFPGAYASLFSFLYLPLLFVLWALIVRGIAMEFRGKGKTRRWRAGWDLATMIGSGVATLGFGIVFGNLFRGLPIDSSGFHATFGSLLNPYALLTALVFLAIFLHHGARWIAYKTTGSLAERAGRLANTLWIVVLAGAALFLVVTAFATRLYDNYLAGPLWFAVPLVCVGTLVASRFVKQDRRLLAFLLSAASVATFVFTAVIGLFPYLIPSTLDPAYGLSIENAASGPYTLRIMTIVAFIFVPIVIIYQFAVYRYFRRPVDLAMADEEAEGY